MFALKFAVDNQAFYDAPKQELSRILAEVSAKVLAGEYSGKVQDLNGNTVGEWSLA